MSDLRHITTARLLLEAVSTADAEPLFPILGDPAGWRHDPAHCHPNLGRTQAWVDTAAARWESDGLSYWTVRLAADGQVVGVGGAQRRPGGSWNVYYQLATSAWARGYATELGRAALIAAHGHDAGVSVAAWIVEHNHPSRRVAERLGLVDHGPWIDVYDGVSKLVYADRPPDEHDL